MKNFETNFGTISPKKENKVKKSNSEKGFTRRDFLKSLAAVTALSAVGIKAFDSLTNFTEDDEELSNFLKKQNTPTKEQVEIEKQTEAIIGKTFREQLLENDSINLNRDTKQAIYKHWYDKYKPGGTEYENGLIAGLERMRPWIAEIKNIFESYNVPEKYIYLAIAESHFELNAKSEKSAIGPYQITKHTAELEKLDMNMHITDSFDQRRDPIRSAELCAKHLRHSHDEFTQKWSVPADSDDSWDLALMDYNGGFTNVYLKHIIKQESIIPIEITGEHILQENETLTHVALKYRTSAKLIQRANEIADDDIRKLRPTTVLKIPQKRSISMNGFNEWLASDINQKISRELTHTVKKGEVVSTIADKLNVSTQALKDENNIGEDNLIQVGQKLRIPKPETTEQLVTQKLKSISEYSENINYPEKFKAIFDIINSEQLDRIFTEATTHYTEKDIPKMNKTRFTYEVSTGNTLGAIANKFKKQYPNTPQTKQQLIDKFVKTNKLKDRNSIRAGQTLVLEIDVERPATISDIAKKYNTTRITIIQLNPALIDVAMKLPPNIKIRVPK